MARLWQSGFELNSTTAGVEWTTVTGSTIQTGTARTGTYAGQVTSLTTLTAQGFEYQFASAASNGPYYLRFYINVGTLPTAANTIMVLNNATGLVGTPEASIKLDNTGAFSLFNGLVTQIGSASSTITTNTWHSVELWFDRSPAAASQVLKARLDGVEFASASNLTITLGVLSATFGGNLNSEAQTTGNWFFDDIAINDSTGSNQNTYTGEGQIVHMHPTGAGDNTTWGIFAGTSNWNAVSEVTPNGNTSAVQSLTGGQLDDYAMTASSVIGATDTINVVAVGAYYEGTGASANSKFRLRLKASSAGTVTETADIDPTSTGYITNSKTSPLNYQLVSYFQPGTSTPWTKAVLGTSQVGLNLSSASTNRARISTEWMSVDFTPATGVNTGQGSIQNAIHPGITPSNLGRFMQSAPSYGGQVPTAPTALTITADNEYRTVLQWADNSTVPYAVTNFIVERGTDNISFSQIGNVAGSNVFYLDLTCSASTLYYYRVKGRNSYGDSTYTSSVSITTPIAGQPWTAKIQGWLYGTNPYSPIADYVDGRTVDALKPEYMTVAAGGVITEEDAPASGAYAFNQANAWGVKNYSNKQYVTVSSGYTNFHALMGNGTNQTNGITTLVNFCTANGFSGVELDWEGYSSWTSGDYSTFKTFLSSLASSLHSNSLKLIVVGPPIGDPTVYSDLKQSFYLFKYEDIAPLVDYVCVLAYDYEYDYGANSPVQPLGWLQAIITWTIAKVGWANRSQIIIGMPAYGYHGTTGGFSITLDAYKDSVGYTGFSTAIRDASSAEMMWANGGTSYVYQDVVSVNTKRQTIEDMGIQTVSVWYLGGNLWFNGRVESQVSTTHLAVPSTPIHPGNGLNNFGRFLQFPAAYSNLVVANVSISQVTATLTVAGGTQSVSAVNIVSLTQIAGAITATGGTQGVTSVQNQTVTQTVAVLTANGGLQSVTTIQDQNISQVAAVLTATGGTQSVSTANIVSITQVATILTVTGGVQVISAATTTSVSIAQIAASITASGGTQVVASSQIVGITQVTSSVIASGGTQSVSTVNDSSVAQVAAVLTTTGGTQSVTSVSSSSISQVAAVLTATGGTQVAVVVSSSSLSQIAASITATGDTQVIAATRKISVGQVGATLTMTGGVAVLFSSRFVALTQLAATLTARTGTQLVRTYVPVAWTPLKTTLSSGPTSNTVSSGSKIDIVQGGGRLETVSSSNTKAQI